MDILDKEAVFAKAAEQLSDYSFLESKGVLHEYSDSSLIPSAKALRELVELCRSVFFPGFYGEEMFLSDAPEAPSNSSSPLNSPEAPSNSPSGGSTLAPGSLEVSSLLRRIHELLVGQIAAGLYMDERPKHGEVCNAEGIASASPVVVPTARAGIKESRERSDKDTVRQEADRIATLVVERLPEIKALLETDVEAAYKGDPAAATYSEVVSCYPAIRAISIYRLAHVMHQEGVPLIPRILTEMAHSETGIDIHPAAQIGSHFTIDHGTGVVIGATTIIGNNVKLYQGVTLGAKSFPLGKDGLPIKGILRHAILKDNVIVNTDATIEGRVTVGEGAVIGGNMWITDDVPAGAKLALQCR